MKTVIIWETFEESLKFLVVEGDKRHLDEVYLNDFDGNEALQDELNLTLYTPEGEGVPLLDKFPLDVVRAEGEVAVICCGFIP